MGANMEPKSGKISEEIWMNFGTCLDAVFGGVSAVLAARIEPRGGKKGGRNDEYGTNTICIINYKNQYKINILSQQRSLSEAKCWQKWAKNEVNLEARCGSNFASFLGGFWDPSGGQKWSKSGAEK